MALSLANGRHPLALQADAQCKIGQLHPTDMSAMTSRAPDWPLFSAAELVARERLPAALPHVTRRISDFLDSLSRAGVFAASCRRGDSERELSYLFQRDPSPLTQTMVRHAAAGGHAHVLKWLKEHDDGLNRSLWKDYNFSPMDEAAKTGQLCVLQWLHENVEDCYAGRAMSWAASSGHLDAVKWLHSNRQDLCVNYAMDFAAANCHLHVVQYLHDNRREGCTTWAMDGAATHGHLQVVQWLYQNRSEGCTKAAVDGAAANGHLEVVQYLLQTVRLPDEKHWLGWAFTAAAANGRVAVVDWVHSTFRDNFSDSMLTFALSDASDNGHDEMMQWLSSQLKERR